jgi:hypothetical protein
MIKRDRKRLIMALLVAPLIIALPTLWPHLQESDFVSANLDLLLIFFAIPYAVALWLGLGLFRR